MHSSIVHVDQSKWSQAVWRVSTTSCLGSAAHKVALVRFCGLTMKGTEQSLKIVCPYRFILSTRYTGHQWQEPSQHLWCHGIATFLPGRQAFWGVVWDSAYSRHVFSVGEWDRGYHGYSYLKASDSYLKEYEGTKVYSTCKHVCPLSLHADPCLLCSACW